MKWVSKIFLMKKVTKNFNFLKKLFYIFWKYKAQRSVCLCLPLDFRYALYSYQRSNIKKLAYEYIFQFLQCSVTNFSINFKIFLMHIESTYNNINISPYIPSLRKYDHIKLEYTKPYISMEPIYGHQWKDDWNTFSIIYKSSP